VAEALAMGRGLSTLAMVVVLAGLGGYIYYLDSKPATDGPDAKEKAFASVVSDDIEEVQIALGEEKPAKLTKADGTWKLVEPSAADADSTELSSITSSLSTVDIQRVVDEQGKDLAQYGLAPARIDVSFKVKGQPTARRILFGDKTTTGGDIYAKLAESPRVFLVSSYLESTFKKDPFSLRDKTILKVDRSKVDGFVAQAGTTVLEFAKKGSDWALVKPIAARADFGAVEGAIERLATANMQGITTDQASDLTQYGLDKPVATMTVKTGSSSAVLTLGRTENAVVFAKDASRPLVFTVAPTLRDDVIKAVGEFRRKDVFDFRSFTATKLELTRGTETQVFEKSKSKDKDGKDVEGWKNAKGEAVDAMKIDDVLTKVAGLRATSFEDAAPAALKAPSVTVKATFDGKTEVVTLAKMGTDAFAARQDEPGAAKFDAASLDDAIKALDALR
jgi:hypothetical protein